MFPVNSYSQYFLGETEKVYNVYRRDSAVIHSYNYEFAKTFNNYDSIVNEKSTLIYVTKKYEKRCLGEIELYILITIEAKNNRARLSFDQVKYKANTDKCSSEGTLLELLDCNKCGLSSSYLKEDIIKYKETVYEYYHKFLKGKSDDGNW